ncbi:MAG: hypothetical protein QY326_06010 [Bdellovibrionota bacterium]|nr:MAG: hypothetical protein QY326_06010 [Bdellovibrionota bacterium]
MLSLLLLLPCAAGANEASSAAFKRRQPYLPDGASPNEVRMLWGDPAERVVREVKGEVVWRYGATELIFRNGRLASNPNAVGAHSVDGADDALPEALKPARLHVLPPHNAPPSAIFKEIMNVYGEEGGAPAPPSVATPFGMPGQLPSRDVPIMPMQMQMPDIEDMEKGQMIE